MSPIVRKTIFYVFVGLFFITAPLVLFDTAGYRYNFAKNRVEKTGILRIDSLPTGATVALNGEIMSEKTPAQLTRLLPDEYLVRVTKQGFLPWQKKLEVRNGEATFAKEIVLFADVAPTLVAAVDIRSATISDDGSTIVALRVTKNVPQIVMSRDNGVDWTVVATIPRLPSNTFFLLSPDNMFVLIGVSYPEGNIDTKIFSLSTTAVPIDLTSLVGRRSNAAMHWSNNSALLTVASLISIITINPVTNNISIAPMPNTQDAWRDGKTLYTLTDRATDVALQKNDVDNVSRANTTSDVAIFSALPWGQYRFLSVTDGYIVVRDANQQKIFVIDKKNGDILMSFLGRDIAWNPTNNARLLAWTDTEIDVIDLATKTKTLVTRVSTPIGNCAWHPSGNAIIFSTPNAIIATELDNRGEKNSVTLAQIKTPPVFTIDATGKNLFFSANINDVNGFFTRNLQ